MCHDAGLRLVPCGRCRTATHAECRAELGRCPSLGCPGLLAAAPRRRPRANRTELALALALLLVLLVSPFLLAPAPRTPNPGAWGEARLETPPLNG